MQNIPSASAMDAAAGGSGPSTMVLPWISAAEPDQILRYAGDLTGQLAQVAALFDQLNRLRGQLRTAWPSGAASSNAATKLAAASDAFTKILNTVQRGVAEIKAAAEVIRAFQAAYQSVVGSVNPTVASLMSNPFTQAAATSLAVSSTAGLSASMATARGTLDTIGTARIMALVQALATVLRDIQRLLTGGTDPSPTQAPGQTTPGQAQPLPAPSGPAQTMPAPAAPGSGLGGGGQQIPQVVTLPDGRTAVIWPANAGW